jgi:hypothetical protein
VATPAVTAPAEFPTGLAPEWKDVAALTVIAAAEETDAGVLTFASLVANQLGRGKDGKPSFDPQELLKVRVLAKSIHASYTVEEIRNEQNRLLGIYTMTATPEGELNGVKPEYSSGVQEVLALAGRRQPQK